jgi:hypothetical protein
MSDDRLIDQRASHKALRSVNTVTRKRFLVRVPASDHPSYRVRREYQYVGARTPRTRHASRHRGIGIRVRSALPDRYARARHTPHVKDMSTDMTYFKFHVQYQYAVVCLF